MIRQDIYPFAAVVGQEKLKKALLLNLVNPKIGGVLVSGEKGTAKSTLIRALPELVSRKGIVEVPLNVTVDRLVGSIDIERMMQSGQRCVQNGLLSEADEQILYVDEINLLSEHLTSILLEVSSSGYNRIEREGISHTEPARFALIGSMNPEEGQIRPHLLDRFGLYVSCKGETDAARRTEIIRRRLSYEQDPTAFRARFSKETEILSEKIAAAVRHLPSVRVDEPTLRLAAELSREGGCAGHRAELVLTETARAIAALDGSPSVTDAHLREAAFYALPHRLREPIALPPPQDLEEPPETPEQDRETPPDREAEQSTPPSQSQQNNDPNSGADRKTENDIRETEDIPLELRFQELKKASGSGKRAKVRSDSARGRYIRDRLPTGRVTDVAVDATLRQAVLHPKAEGETLALTVRSSDLREKVREQRCGATILFCVDASASMGVGKRMAAVKGAVLALLTDAYQKRDAVGILTFRGDQAQLVLPLTRSVDLARKYLNGLKTGGKTPLAAGLERSYEILKAAKARDKEILPYVVLLSDGRANQSLTGNDPFEEAVRAAAKIVSEKMNLLILDTESGRIRFDFAKKLAERTGCGYIRLTSLSGSEIERQVKSHLDG